MLTPFSSCILSVWYASNKPFTHEFRKCSLAFGCGANGGSSSGSGNSGSGGANSGIGSANSGIGSGGNGPNINARRLIDHNLMSWLH